MSIAPRNLLALAALTTALALPGAASSSSSRGVSMEILVDGRPLQELRGNGNVYVEARKNRNYTIRLRNDTGGRVAVALAVDGLNSIDAKHSSARDAAKWVLSPYETAEIQGWQVDDAHARKFLFTSEEKSYGAWLGDTRNLGVISAVFFAEKERPVCCVEPRPYDRPYYGGRGGDGDALSMDEAEQAPAREARSRKSAGKPAAEASADVGSVSGSAGALRRGDRGGVAVPSPTRKKDELAATGMGSKTRHEVQWTSFELEPSPLASFELRYAYRDELVSLGVDPDWSPVTPDVRRRERAAGFAPDPGTACCR